MTPDFPFVLQALVITLLLRVAVLLVTKEARSRLDETAESILIQLPKQCLPDYTTRAPFLVYNEIQ